MDRKKIMYIGIIFIITVITSITYFSYGFLTSKNEYHGRVNMIVGTLDYKINSADLDNNNSITLQANESEKIDIEITSLNNIDSKYELYYETESSDVEVGYSSDTVDNVSGTISSKGTKKVTAVLKNKSNSNEVVTFGIQGGFTYNNITLEEGRIAIENQLNLCSLTPGDVVKTAGYTGAADPFKVPCDGNYKVELWGAQGAYTSGVIQLNYEENLYLQVGQEGQGCEPASLCSGYAYNGGGADDYRNSSSYSGGSRRERGGAGATDIRYFGNDYTPTSSDLQWNSSLGLNSRIMVAAGGSNSGGLIGYKSNYPTGGTNGNYGTQTSGGILSNSTISGGFGYGGNGYATTRTPNCNPNYGSSGGYYGGSGGIGGAASCSNNGNYGESGGSSSFISGHAGCIAIAEGSTSEPRAIKSGCDATSTDIECSIHYSGLYFTDTKMIDGTGYSWTTVKGSLEQMPNPNGGYYSSGTGHTGNGYARITYLGPNYTITFNTNNGNNIESRTVLQGNTIGELPIPTRGTDYFEGWYLDSNFTTKVDSTYVPIGSITLYARYGTEVDLNLAGRTRGYPSDTAGDLNTKRSYSMNTYVVGLSFNNYYYPSNVANYSLTSNSVYVKQVSGYGVGLPMQLLEGEYILSGDITTTSTNGVVSIIKHSSDGTVLSVERNYENMENGNHINSKFEIESNVNHEVVLITCSASVSTGQKEITLSNMHLYKLD